MKKKIFEFIKNYNTKYTNILGISSAFIYFLVNVGKMENFIIMATGLLSAIFMGWAAIIGLAKEIVATKAK